MKFQLGQLVATPGALQAMEQTGETPLPFIARHQSGDWGIVNASDKKANERSLKDGSESHASGCNGGWLP